MLFVPNVFTTKKKQVAVTNLKSYVNINVFGFIVAQKLYSTVYSLRAQFINKTVCNGQCLFSHIFLIIKYFVVIPVYNLEVTVSQNLKCQHFLTTISQNRIIWFNVLHTLQYNLFCTWFSNPQKLVQFNFMQSWPG